MCEIRKLFFGCGCGDGVRGGWNPGMGVGVRVWGVVKVVFCRREVQGGHHTTCEWAVCREDIMGPQEIHQCTTT